MTDVLFHTQRSVVAYLELPFSFACAYTAVVAALVVAEKQAVYRLPHVSGSFQCTSVKMDSHLVPLSGAAEKRSVRASPPKCGRPRVHT